MQIVGTGIEQKISSTIPSYPGLQRDQRVTLLPGHWVPGIQATWGWSHCGKCELHDTLCEGTASCGNIHVRAIERASLWRELREARDVGSSAGDTRAASSFVIFPWRCTQAPKGYGAYKHLMHRLQHRVQKGHTGSAATAVACDVRAGTRVMHEMSPWKCCAGHGMQVAHRLVHACMG